MTLIVMVSGCTVDDTEIDIIVDAKNNDQIEGKGSNNVETNTAIGVKTLFRNTTGKQNTAIGFNALYENVSGDSNVAIGQSALYYNSKGWGNVAIGTTSLYTNSFGKYNVAVGVDAMKKNTIGSYNTAINYDALHNNTTGSGNTAVGYLSMYSNTTGSENVALGFAAGGGASKKANVSGNQNTWLGYQAGPISDKPLNNSIAIGYQAKTTESNQVVLGNKKVVSTILQGAVTIGDGTPISRVLSSTVNLDFPSTCASCVAELSFEMPGVSLIDAITIGVPLASVTATGSYTSWVSAPDVITIRFSPKRLENPKIGVFRFVVIKF